MLSQTMDSRWVCQCFILIAINKSIMSSTDYRDKNFSLADGLTRKQAERKLRSDLNNVQTMKNRLKVLTSQADYNRFREKHQTQKIEKHFEIHEQLVKERKEVDQICKSRDRSQEKKEANSLMNIEMKQRLEEAFEKIKKEKEEQYNLLRIRSQKNSEFLAKRKRKNLEERRIMHENVKKMENNIKQSISRYASEKKEELKTFKVMEKRSMCELSEMVEKQLKQLSSKEQDLINMSSQSLKASRLRDQQIKDLYGGKFFGKSVHLPGISKVVNQTQNTR